MFAQIQGLIQAHHNPFAIVHVRAHSGHPGPLALGNQTIDKALITLAQETPIQKAQLAHKLHHLNSHSLCLTYGLTKIQAKKKLLKNYNNCDVFCPVPHLGVNP